MFKLVIEALRFYKIKNHRRVQMAFAMLLVFTAVVEIANFVNYQKILQQLYDAVLTSRLEQIQLSGEIWLAIGISLGRQFLMMLVVFWYANEFVASYRSNMGDLKIVNDIKIPVLPWHEQVVASLSKLPPNEVDETNKQFWRNVPRILAYCLGLMVLFVVSSVLFFVPFVVVATATCFAPIFMVQRSTSIKDAIAQSKMTTRGFKFMIFLNWILISFGITLVQQLLTGLMFLGVEGTAVLQSLFVPIIALSGGRLIGILYVIVVEGSYLNQNILQK